MSKQVHTVRLNNGYDLPILGYGTYLAQEGQCVQLVKKAIDAGYRHIDTAYVYQNEVEIGQAIRDKIAEGVIRREDLFVTTKLGNTFHDPQHVEEAFRRSFEMLNIGYIDLYLMHTPMGLQFTGFEYGDMDPKDAAGNLLHSEVDYVETWKAMEKLVASGKVRSIGLSNFNSEQIKRILEVATIKPVNNQVEVNPGYDQRKLISFCQKHEITVTAYGPMGRPHRTTYGNRNALDDAKVIEIGRKYNKTSGQIILRYLIDIGTIPIPYSTNEERIRQNIDVFDFKLNDQEIEYLASFHSERTIPFLPLKSHKYYPFNIEF
ncbi:1,5-anhydro-D-fructose reductase-like [Anopheles ziemanni]|uniref:1,5-anhydro-D-fructose reductase-like n=1 Tax=Anopheles coustani TaxID=139045 RepID=UPI0026593712|nr:1,5-anhydro-D-fructose reductase-like [Anopheles coustani]XP_058172957.1 1,5-anhydro-D-fructose reductase-like [Anopheles ziemanni]